MSKGEMSKSASYLLIGSSYESYNVNIQFTELKSTGKEGGDIQSYYDSLTVNGTLLCASISGECLKSSTAHVTCLQGHVTQVIQRIEK